MKVLNILLLILLFTGCTDYYKAADKDIELIKYHQNKIDSLSMQVQDSFVIKEIAHSHFVIGLFVDAFKDHIKKVDTDKQLELVQKFDRVYILNIER